MPSAITILADGFEEIEAITYIDLLRRANIVVTVLGLETLEVRGSHNIRLRTDLLLKDFSGPHDALILPGGMPGSANLAASPLVIEQITSSFSQGKICAAICAGPIAFAKAGILNGLRATCYPGQKENLLGARLSEEPVVQDKNVITSRGVATAIPFALEIITSLAGKDAADSIRSAILYTN